MQISPFNIAQSLLEVAGQSPTRPGSLTDACVPVARAIAPSISDTLAAMPWLNGLELSDADFTSMDSSVSSPSDASEMDFPLDIESALFQQKMPSQPRKPLRVAPAPPQTPPPSAAPTLSQSNNMLRPEISYARLAGKPTKVFSGSYQQVLTIMSLRPFLFLFSSGSILFFFFFLLFLLFRFSFPSLSPHLLPCFTLLAVSFLRLQPWPLMRAQPSVLVWQRSTTGLRRTSPSTARELPGGRTAFDTTCQ